MPTPLETPRLILRGIGEADLPALQRLLQDREVNTFLPWFPVSGPEETFAFWASHIRGREFYYGVFRRSGGPLIGYIQASTDEAHDFGYALRREDWHQGLMTEAGRALIGQLRAAGFAYITATHDRNNPRSGGVMRNLGMRYCYSYEEQWQPKNLPVVFRLYQLNLDGNDARVYEPYRARSPRSFVEPGL